MADMAAHFFVFFSHTIWYSNLPYFIKYSLSFPPRTVFIFFPLAILLYKPSLFHTIYSIVPFLSFSFLRISPCYYLSFFFITNLPHFTNYIFSFLPSFANQTKNNRLKSSFRHLPIFLFLTTPTAALSSLLPPLPRSLFPLSPTLHLFRPFHSSPRRFPSSIPRSLTSRIFNLAP